MSYDNVCKFLVEQDPLAFANWLLPEPQDTVQLLKTELSQEPIRADSVVFLQTGQQILHLEFQTTPDSEPPLPFRMLDYSVRLKRQYDCPVTQVILFLRETTTSVVFEAEYRDRSTHHRYEVIRLWEQSPAPLLQNPALLPLATLMQTDAPTKLLSAIATQIAEIPNAQARSNLTGCTEILAGLRFDQDLIRRLFREEIMRESVIYQDILREGRQQGLEQGRQQGLVQLILRQLHHKFGAVPEALSALIAALSAAQLERLAEALLDFTELAELEQWLAAQEPGQSADGNSSD